MKAIMIAAGAAAVAVPLAAPTAAQAQSREVRQEIRECQRELRRADNRNEYRREQRECRREIRQAQRETRRDRREARRDWRSYRNYDWNRYEPGQRGYYADQYYRPGSYYADRRIGYGDRLYRGRDGRYYCRRSDGTTGLIVGAGVGALLGNRIDLGGSAAVRTVVGGAAGALIGRAIERGSLRCD